MGLIVRRIRDSEDRPIEIMQFEQQTLGGMKNSEIPREMQGTIEHTNIDFLGLPCAST